MSTTSTASQPPSPSRVASAIKRFVQADEAVRAHGGAHAGEEWERKDAEWNRAYAALRRVGHALIAEESSEA